MSFALFVTEISIVKKIAKYNLKRYPATQNAYDHVKIVFLQRTKSLTDKEHVDFETRNVKKHQYWALLLR